MALQTSQVYRCLEKKTQVWGFEILDLFAVSALLALLNFLFRGMPYNFVFTWAPALSLALFLRIGKIGKPENYFLHLARFHFLPRLYSSFYLANKRSRFIKKPKKGVVHDQTRTR